MSNDEIYARNAAMDDALALHKGTAVSAVDLAVTAETIRLYRNGQLFIETGFPINDTHGTGEHIRNVGSVGVNSLNASNCIVKDTLPISDRKIKGDAQDKSFSIHASSSSPKDGESVGEVTTPSRTETVTPYTQPVMQPCTHTRTDGEGV